MKIIAGGGGRLAGVFCVVATALLLNACQQSAGSGSDQALSYQQKVSDDQTGWQKRHCCRRAGRNGNK